MRSFIFSSILVLTLQSFQAIAQNNFAASNLQIRVPGFLAGTAARIGNHNHRLNELVTLGRAPKPPRPQSSSFNGKAWHQPPTNQQELSGQPEGSFLAHEVDHLPNSPVVSPAVPPPTPSVSDDAATPRPELPSTPEMPIAKEPNIPLSPITQSPTESAGPPPPALDPTQSENQSPSPEPPGEPKIPNDTIPTDPGLPPLPSFPTDAKIAAVNDSDRAKSRNATEALQSSNLATDTSAGINEIFLAGDSFNTVQFAPSGKAGYVVWRSNHLVYRERNESGWTETILVSSGKTYSPNPSGGEHRFQPAVILLYDSNSRAHVLRQAGSSLVRHQQTSSGSLEAVEEIPLPGYPELVDAQFGPSDTLHVALVTSNGSVEHGVIANGRGLWAKVAQTRGNPRLYLPQSYAPRYFSLAIDSRNNAHLIFTPELNLAVGSEGYTRPYSQLHYASNKSGQWRTQLVQDIPDKSGDAAYGASIAIGPGDQPVIASWYNERASTGSSQNSRLLWHSLDNSGSWKSTVIANSPNGYVAGDGVRGTGFAPYVRFDEKGHPHIIFSDHASQHFDTGQNEYAGQIQHLYHDGLEWRAQTIHSQSNPLAAQIIYPAFAVRHGELLVIALERKTVWENDYRRARSTYRFLQLSARY